MERRRKDEVENESRRKKQLLLFNQPITPYKNLTKEAQIKHKKDNKLSRMHAHEVCHSPPTNEETIISAPPNPHHLNHLPPLLIFPLCRSHFLSSSNSLMLWSIRKSLNDVLSGTAGHDWHTRNLSYPPLQISIVCSHNVAPNPSMLASVPLSSLNHYPSSFSSLQ